MRQLKIAKQITNRETESLEKYFKDIGKIELITAEEEVILAQKIRDGDKIALEKMVKANLRFVISVAKQFQNRGLTLGDLINEGNLGLVKAASRFDEKRGFKFISYAVWWIRQAIIQALGEQPRIVRLPLNQVGHVHKVSRKVSDLEQKFQREPTNQELSEELDMAEDEVAHIRKISSKQLSMDEPFAHGDDNSLLDVLGDNHTKKPDANLLLESLRDEIQRALVNSLTKREALIISLSFGLDGNPPRRLDQIGIDLGITRERVRQLKDMATKKLRNGTHSKMLKAYLGE